MPKLTKFQKAQLVYLYQKDHVSFQYKWRDSKGHLWNKSKWTKMVNALCDAGFVDCFGITPEGKAYAEQIQDTTDMSVLD